MPGYVLLDLGLDGTRTGRPSIAPSAILRSCVCCRVGPSTWAPNKHNSSATSWSSVISAQPGHHQMHKTCQKHRDRNQSGMLLAAVQLSLKVILKPWPCNPCTVAVASNQSASPISSNHMGGPYYSGSLMHHQQGVQLDTAANVAGTPYQWVHHINVKRHKAFLNRQGRSQ